MLAILLLCVLNDSPNQTPPLESYFRLKTYMSLNRHGGKLDKLFFKEMNNLPHPNDIYKLYPILIKSGDKNLDTQNLKTLQESLTAQYDIISRRYNFLNRVYNANTINANEIECKVIYQGTRSGNIYIYDNKQLNKDLKALDEMMDDIVTSLILLRIYKYCEYNIISYDTEGYYFDLSHYGHPELAEHALRIFIKMDMLTRNKKYDVKYLFVDLEWWTVK